MKNILKLIMTILGNGILVTCIAEEIDGVGRFAMILFGVTFSVIGSIMSFDKKDKE